MRNIECPGCHTRFDTPDQWRMADVGRVKFLDVLLGTACTADQLLILDVALGVLQCEYPGRATAIDIVFREPLDRLMEICALTAFVRVEGRLFAASVDLCFRSHTGDYRATLWFEALGYVLGEMHGHFMRGEALPDGAETVAAKVFR